MDVRLTLTSAGVCLALLLGACSPGEEKRQVSLEEKTAQFEKSLDAITDPKLKDAVAELGGSLLLLERAQLKLDSKPVETEYGDDALAVLKHYPTPRPWSIPISTACSCCAKTSSSDYLIDLQPVFPSISTFPPRSCFPMAWNGSRSP